MDSSSSLRVLLIEDEPSDVELVRRHVRRASPELAIQLIWVASLRQGLDQLGKHDVDVVLLDLNLPDSDGLFTLERLRQADTEVPVVVFTGSEDVHTALRALEAGAQDYLGKDELVGPAPLLRAIGYAVERRRMERAKHRVEEQLAQSEKLASLGVLSGGLAMGFNHLLGCILEDADEAAQDLGGVPRLDRARRRVHSIRRAALRAGEMTSQLRDYAAARPMPGHRIDLSDFVRESGDMIQSLAPMGIAVAFSLHRDPLPVVAGRLQLHQLLLALVQNALESIDDESGTVWVSTGQEDVSAERLGECAGSASARPGRYVVLGVADSGCGVDPAVRSRIFDPFFTTKAAGRGLGLAAAAGIARQCGALIHLENAPNGGSVFRVLFPQPGTRD